MRAASGVNDIVSIHYDSFHSSAFVQWRSKYHADTLAVAYGSLSVLQSMIKDFTSMQNTKC